MGNRSGRPATWQLWLVLAAALTAVSVLLTVTVMGGARQALLREATTSAAVVGRAMVRQFDAPIRYGVPLTAVVGVPEFLDELRRSTSGIAYIAVTDVKGKVLYASGAAVGSELPAPESPDELGPESELAPDITPIDPYLNVRWPLGDPGRALGFVHVGADERLALPFLSRLGDEILVAWVIALLVAFQITAFLVVHHLHLPTIGLRRLLAAVRAADFARAGTTGQVAATANVLGVLRGWVHEVNARYQGLAQRIEEARASHFDPATIAEIDSVRQIVPGRFASERAASEGRSSYLQPRTGFALFFLVAAVEVCRPFLLLQAQALTLGWPRLPPIVAGAVPATAFLLFAGLGILVSGRLAPGGRSRRAIVPGFVLACACLGLAGVGAGYAQLLVCLALAGLGVGLSLGAGARGLAARLLEARGADAVLALPVVLGLVSGPALGGYVVDRLGAAAIFPVAALLLAAAAALAFAESRQDGAMEEGPVPAADLPPTSAGAAISNAERLAALLALMVIGGVLFALLPASWAEAEAPLPTPVIGLLAALLGVGALALRPFSGPLGRHCRLSTRLGLAGVVVALGLVAGLVWLPPPIGGALATIAMGVAVGLGVGAAPRRGLHTPPLLPFLDQGQPEPRMLAALALACLAVGPAAMALLIVWWGIAGAAAAAAGVSLVAAAGLLTLGSRRGRDLPPVL